MSDPIKVHKAISAAGLMSRRAAEDLIKQGRVTVDGRPVTLGQRVDPDTARIQVDGKQVPVAPDRVTYLLYKPTGVISTASDPQGRRTVVQMVPSDPRVWPVGRLDADSEGLILLTNDGDLTNLVTHPGHGITKTYTVLVTGRVTNRFVNSLHEGVELDDGPARALSARVIDTRGETAMLEMVMVEGRNREIRRMCDALGHPVTRLVRTAVGPIRDRTVKPGEWRALTPAEVADLYAAADG